MSIDPMTWAPKLSATQCIWPLTQRCQGVKIVSFNCWISGGSGDDTRPLIAYNWPFDLCTWFLIFIVVITYVLESKDDHCAIFNQFWNWFISFFLFFLGPRGLLVLPSMPVRPSVGPSARIFPLLLWAPPSPLSTPCHPCHLCRGPDSISRTFLERLVLVVMIGQILYLPEQHNGIDIWIRSQMARGIHLFIFYCRIMWKGNWCVENQNVFCSLQRATT